MTQAAALLNAAGERANLASAYASRGPQTMRLRKPDGSAPADSAPAPSVLDTGFSGNLNIKDATAVVQAENTAEAERQRLDAETRGNEASSGGRSSTVVAGKTVADYTSQAGESLLTPKRRAASRVLVG